MMTEVGPGLSHLISREKCQTKDHVQLPLKVFVGAKPRNPFHVFEERLVELKVAPLHPAGRKELLHCFGDCGFEIRQETFWVPARCSVLEAIDRPEPEQKCSFGSGTGTGTNMLFRYRNRNKNALPVPEPEQKCSSGTGTETKMLFRFRYRKSIFVPVDLCLRHWKAIL